MGSGSVWVYEILVVIVEGKRAVWGGVNLRPPIVTNGGLCRCVKVRIAIELSFGMMSGVGQAFMC